MKSDNVLLTICARGGSKGVKNKNIRLVGGIPLIAYTIRQAIAWGKAKHIVVSTDSKAIAGIAKKYGAETPFLRPQKISGDTSAKILAIRHALIQAERMYKETYDVVIDLDATSPIRTPEDIESAYRIFLQKRPSAVFSVTEARKNPYFNMVEKDKRGNIVLCKPSAKKIMRRQDAPVVYDMNASIYVYDRSYILSPSTSTVISDNNAVYVMKDVSAVDIDREIDFQFIEFLVSKGIVQL